MPNGFQMGILDWETPPQPQRQPGAAGKELGAGSQDAMVGSCSERVPVDPGCPRLLGCWLPLHRAQSEQADELQEAPSLADPEHGVQQALLSLCPAPQVLGMWGWGQVLLASPAFRGASAPALADTANTARRSSAAGAAASAQQSRLQCEKW